jgi:P27 family predicted phage terminase small subunit
MGRRGPAPKPTALRFIDGNAGHRPLNTHEPVPPPGEPEPPEWLDERARKVWDQVMPRLYRIGLARSIDAGALGRYCVLFVMWVDAADFVRKNGTTYPVRAEPATPKGQGRILYFREFPQAAELRKLGQQLITLEREFGQTPASRSRIHLENEKDAAKDTGELRRRMFGV